MGKHSMKNKKPRAVLSVGPVWLVNVYRKAKVGAKRIRVLVKQYEPHDGPNRAHRRAGLAKFRRAYGWTMYKIVIDTMKKGLPLDAKVRTALDEFFAGEVYRQQKQGGAR